MATYVSDTKLLTHNMSLMESRFGELCMLTGTYTMRKLRIYV